MRFNDKELTVIAQKDGDLVGRLQYTQFKGPPGSTKTNGFRDRFFKLIGNLLFYFRLNDVGSADMSEPVGVIVLENYSVQPECDVDLSFAFGIIFLDEPDRRHVFTARTDEDVQIWINTLQTASYQHWSQVLARKRSNLKALLDSRRDSVMVSAARLPTNNPTSSTSTINDNPLIYFDEDSKSHIVRHFVTPNVAPPPIPPRPGTRKKNDDLIQF